MDFKVRISRKAIIISLVVLLLAAILCFVVIPWFIAWNDFCHIENNKYNAFNEHIKFAEFEIHNWGMGPTRWDSKVYELYTDGTLQYYLKTRIGTIEYYHQNDYEKVKDVLKISDDLENDDLINTEEKRAQLSQSELVRVNKFLRENIEGGKYRTEKGTTIIEGNFFTARYISGADGSGYKITYYRTDGSKDFSFGPGYVDDEVRDWINLFEKILLNPLYMEG